MFRTYKHSDFIWAASCNQGRTPHEPADVAKFLSIKYEFSGNLVNYFPSIFHRISFSNFVHGIRKFQGNIFVKFPKNEYLIGWNLKRSECPYVVSPQGCRITLVFTFHYRTGSASLFNLLLRSLLWHSLMLWPGIPSSPLWIFICVFFSKKRGVGGKNGGWIPGECLQRSERNSSKLEPR